MTQVRRASVIGIGAQKTASTWLHGALAQMPGVAASEPKELDFFSARFDRGYEWYERHWSGSQQGAASTRGEGAHGVEVSPSYFIDADAPERAHAYNPDMLIVATLRDPVERAYSNHLHEVRAGHMTGANTVFETALANNPLYIEQGRYAVHLHRWIARFGRERVLVLFQEDIRRDAEGAAREVAAFLGVAMPAGGFVERRANESSDYRNRALGTALWRAGRLARRAGFAAAVERIKTMPGVRDLRAANHKAIRAEVEPMRPETEVRLIETFAPDVARLAALTGQTPPWPRFA